MEPIERESNAYHCCFHANSVSLSGRVVGTGYRFYALVKGRTNKWTAGVRGRVTPNDATAFAPLQRSETLLYRRSFVGTVFERGAESFAFVLESGTRRFFGRNDKERREVYGFRPFRRIGVDLGEVAGKRRKNRRKPATFSGFSEIEGVPLKNRKR